MIAEGTAQLLMTDERYQVTIGKHYSELYNFIESNPISLLIIDYELQDKTALDLLPYLQKKIPQTPVLVYTMHTEFWIIKLLIKKEVAGIVSKNDNTSEIKKAIEVSQGSEFVSKMEGEYDAHIARGGTNVSGGQKQRLAIARAIARNPEIYIFDDSFSALDYKTDSVLRKELKKYTNSATSLIVAQRIGTIINADKIVVLDKGECVGIGTHKELLKNCEVYKEIALSQLSKEELDNA